MLDNPKNQVIRHEKVICPAGIIVCIFVQLKFHVISKPIVSFQLLGMISDAPVQPETPLRFGRRKHPKSWCNILQSVMQKMSQFWYPYHDSTVGNHLDHQGEKIYQQGNPLTFLYPMFVTSQHSLSELLCRVEADTDFEDIYAFLKPFPRRCLLMVLELVSVARIW